MYYNGEDITKKRLEIRDNIAKSLGIEGGYDEIEKARNVGDIHPNGKLVWKEYKPGKFDWRKRRGGDSKSKKSAPKKSAPKKMSDSSDQETTISGLYNDKRFTLNEDHKSRPKNKANEDYKKDKKVIEIEEGFNSLISFNETIANDPFLKKNIKDLPKISDSDWSGIKDGVINAYSQIRSNMDALGGNGGERVASGLMDSVMENIPKADKVLFGRLTAERIENNEKALKEGIYEKIATFLEEKGVKYEMHWDKLLYCVKYELTGEIDRNFATEVEEEFKNYETDIRAISWGDTGKIYIN